jgi:hypothetical protein
VPGISGVVPVTLVAANATALWRLTNPPLVTRELARPFVSWVGIFGPILG